MQERLQFKPSRTKIAASPENQAKPNRLRQMHQTGNATLTRRYPVLLAVAPLVFLISISLGNQANDLQKVIEKGSLTLMTTVSPISYFKDQSGEGGFEYIIAKAFADSLGLRLKIVTVETLRELISASPRTADFIAANLPQNEALMRSLKTAKPYFNVTQQVIYNKSGEKPRNLQTLNGSLATLKSFSHNEQLFEAKKKNPRLSITEIDSANSSDLIQMVHKGEVDYAVVDSLAYTVNRHIYHRAKLASINLESQSVSWLFPKGSDDSLIEASNMFLEDFRSSGKLKALKRRLFSQSKRFSVANSEILEKMVSTRLRSYQEMFREAGKTNNLEWALVAAMGYQESHWNPKAKSPTGVRGMMMLTENTAREMQVEDRLDAKQSIEGGSKYLAKLKARLPKEITGPDRTWFALAAYNVGYGHMEDARKLAARANKNPNLWTNVREHLGTLRNRDVYLTVKHGYARGDEAVAYVDNVRYYTNYIRLQFISQKDRKE